MPPPERDIQENPAPQIEQGAEAATKEPKKSELRLGETYEAAAERQPEETRAEGKKEMTIGGMRLAGMVKMGQNEGIQVS